MKTLEERREYDRNWRLQNPAKIEATKRKYRLSNKVKIRLYDIKYRAENKERLRAKHTERCRVKYRNNSDHRLIVGLRNRIKKVLHGRLKSASTFALVGCDFVGLRAYLQSKFVPGMTWENYGPVWHVDHIRPCASFDLSDSTQQHACFHFSNLQPLFALDNLSKGAKYATGF